MTDQTNKKFGRLAMIAASAVVTVGAMGLAIGQQHAGYGDALSSPMSTGVTVTASVVPPTTPETEMAVPGITGPAPLPVEEQGLPG